MRREYVKLFSPAIGRELELIAYGHGGLPVLVFPSSEGSCHEYEDFKMIHVLAPLIEAGKLRMYCVGSYDSESWYGKHLPLHERAWHNTLYENWIMNQVVPAIAADVKNPKVKLTVTGCSFGAFHSANFALKFPERFNHALCMSGVYDIRFLLHGHHDMHVYFNNPMEYVSLMHGEALESVRRNTRLTLVCGQGQWEDTALASTREFWWLLHTRNIPNYMHLWGHDVAHDWPWWRIQIQYYMSNLVEGKMPWLNI
ncbi:MAG TPA: alpha/beta hydrolase-fold protein [Phycisphaerales bacterium]|nr:alpha/beta hydrolase-fold protein [Phycisphaerales bacterium]